MNFGQIRPLDIANGEGIRVSLFVSGCRNNCKNCFNGPYNDFSHGKKFTLEDEEYIFETLTKPYIKGLSLLGGEPMEHSLELRDILIRLKNRLKEKSLNRDFWIYSGFTLEDILRDKDKTSLLLECDYLVDGPFIDSLKNPNLKFRGSSNQRIININELNL